MTGSPARSVSGREMEGLTAQGFADLPSGDPLAVLTLRERCVFLLRAYRFAWADIARLLRTTNRTWLYECARRARAKLERRAAGGGYGPPEGLTPGGRIVIRVNPGETPKLAGYTFLGTPHRVTMDDDEDD